MHSFKEKKMDLYKSPFEAVGHCSLLPQHTGNGVLDVHARALPHMLR